MTMDNMNQNHQTGMTQEAILQAIQKQLLTLVIGRK